MKDETDLALFLSVGTANRWRLGAEWLASKLAQFGHSPTKADGREIDCGHAFCRDGCAYCWIDAAEKAADRLTEQKSRPPRRRRSQ